MKKRVFVTVDCAVDVEVADTLQGDEADDDALKQAEEIIELAVCDSVSCPPKVAAHDVEDLA